MRLTDQIPNPLHQVGLRPPMAGTDLNDIDDWAKVRRLVRASNNGETIPPIVQIDGHQINGSHRQLAKWICKNLGYNDNISIVDIDDLDLPDNVHTEIIDWYQSGDTEPVDDILSQYC